jgi:homoserine dehydrogenase
VAASGIRGLAVEPGTTVRLVAEATPDRMSVAPVRIDRDDPFAATAGVESMLEVTLAHASAVRVSGPGAGGRATAGAVYGDVARLVAGERPILFGGG